MHHSRVRAAALAVACFAAGLAGAAHAQSADWYRQVTRIIASKQTYPPTAQMRGEEGTAKVKVYISAVGAIEKTELVGGSGSATLDREALALPRRAGNLPAPPGGPTTLTVPITWRLM
ncbi:protein TonB [Novosphingobium capsulatum]|uniref:Protein TonB n=2 Tax=Novosphingobium TaxID=165696 RepID=A0ABU1MRR4_9SPHN|nr:MULTISPECIES: TonB family protein [Novosphingobium]MBB3358856.1 protein TonB [Novosphingobium sp. BK256]MBB3375663.1 protein TonB [Novosphingobium sp. BK280]MBB3379628.1 protein TonB [Novosphingobium sp. BK258]MBB3421323.1 protein TonB [Novosphingobium sp. BK267]MBB3449638.1 protein TonB [Novosphingobium sp. BK352]